jgi:outer membrane protein OmpA-like peptidoglycan-associated protein
MRAAGLTIAALCLGVFGVAAAEGQSKPQFKVMKVPRYDVSVGYNNIRANAPPGICNCFNTNGGFVSLGIHLNDWFGIGGEITGGTSDTIGPLGQGLTLTTFTAGPRFTYTWRRLAPFGEFLVGGAHGGDSYFPSATTFSTSASSFAISTGGGLDVNLNHRFSLRALNVQYLRTTFPNGANNEENHLMVGAGITLRFNGRTPQPKPLPVQAAAPAPPPPPPTVAFTCSTNAANIPLGQMVVITGDARTEPGQQELSYAWETNGGTIEGSGNTVSINTTGMAIGDYRVKGHATLVTTPAIGAECVAVFRVSPLEAPPAPSNTYVTNIDSSKAEKEFHENVKDVYFAVNSAVLRPAAVASISQAAKYLTAHPNIHVLISGWTDPRGSSQFNLALGIKRARAVQTGLTDAGVPPDQLELISNGKSSQVCTTSDQKCWQENRRVSFLMKR